ncbi:MAG: hypothetical protein V3U03_01900 [Myxococcota bacterium]
MMGARLDSMDRVRHQALREGCLLVAILAAFAGFKLVTNPTPFGRMAGDASHYFEVARHVAEGDGLVTSVSVWHQGLRPLPHRSTIYPVWPLLLGGIGRHVGLEFAVTAVPEFLYLLSLVLLYSLANRIAATWGSRTVEIWRVPATLTVGHLAVLLFGISPIYFRFTSLAHTEALAFTLSFAALLALDRTRERSPVPWSALAGALAGLAYLTRSQMIGVPLAITAGLALVGASDRLWLRAALASAAGAIAVCIPWALFLASFVEYFSLRMLVDFSAYRETPELDPYGGFVAVETFAKFLVDRGRGFLVAFRPLGAHSYSASFGPIVYLIPLVALSLLLSTRDRRRLILGLRARAAITPLTTVLAGLAGLAFPHLAHSIWFGGWQFHSRQGLPMIFLIVPALGYLLPTRRERPPAAWRTVALLLMGGSLVYLGIQLPSHIGWRNSPPTLAELELSSWLSAQDPPPLSLSTMARRLSLLSRERFHWIHCEDSAEQTKRYFRYLGIDYLIVSQRGLRCPSFVGMDTELERAAVFGEGASRITVFRPVRPRG